MSNKFNSEEFEIAYNKVFGEDRDLSELSDINLYDFKEVIEAAVKQFYITAPPELEECNDPKYILWRIYKTIHELMQHYSKNDALEILKERNFFDLNNRSTVTRGFVNGPILLCNLQELWKITDNCIKSWLENKKNLIKTGFAKTINTDGIVLGCFCALPVFPSSPKISDEDSLPGTMPLSFYPIQTLSKNNLKEKLIKNSTLHNRLGTDVVPTLTSIPSMTASLSIFKFFKSSISPMENILSHLSSSKIQKKRQPLFDIFSEVLAKLCQYIKTGDTEDLLDYFVSQLSDIINIKEIELYLLMDRLTDEESVIKKVNNVCIPELGDITKIIRLIGFYQKEVELKTIHSVRNSLKDLINTDAYGYPNPSFCSYFDIMDNPVQRQMLDNAVDMFLQKEMTENSFWKDYYCRVNKIFSERYIISEELKQKNTFKPYIQKIRDNIKARYNSEDLIPKKKEHEKTTENHAIDSTNKDEKKVKGKIYPTPPGTTWDMVEMTLIDRNLYVKSGKWSQEIFYHDTEFGDFKTGKPNDMWKLLVYFAATHGKLPFNYHEFPDNTRENLSKYVSKLQIYLQNLLCVEDTSIKRNDKKGIYETQFKIKAEVDKFPYTIVSWEKLGIIETEESTIKIVAIVESKGIGYKYIKECGERDIKIAEQSSEEKLEEFTYTLKLLGLADENGKPDYKGELLLKILRSKDGKIKRKEDDKNMLALNRYLTDFFDIDGKIESCFNFDLKTSIWTARFKAASYLNSPPE